MIFPHYEKTKVVYHLVNINYLQEILDTGISMEGRSNSSGNKYFYFNEFLDQYKSNNIPPWVIRKKAIFASLNFKKDTHWHSHSALLAMKIREDKCWIANENLANEIYDPFILQDIQQFNQAKKYMEKFGDRRAREYWENSLSFKENLTIKRDLRENYDEEVMIFHDIAPRDIQCLMIVTDHCEFTPSKWQQHYKKISQ